MSIEIKECQVVDDYINLGLSSTYKADPKKVEKCLKEIFQSHGLILIDTESNSYKTIRLRFTRILDKLRDNQKAKRHDHYKFDSDKLFFRQTDFPNLCAGANETTDAAR